MRRPVGLPAFLLSTLALLGSWPALAKEAVPPEAAAIKEPEVIAPADISIQVYSRGNIVSSETGLFATLRRTLAQSASAIMWSFRMFGVAVAFLAPWVIAIVAVVWITKRIARARQSKS